MTTPYCHSAATENELDLKFKDMIIIAPTLKRQRTTDSIYVITSIKRQRIELLELPPPTREGGIRRTISYADFTPLLQGFAPPQSSLTPLPPPPCQNSMLARSDRVRTKEALIKSPPSIKEVRKSLGK